jgi:hypothetical protein
MRNDVDLGAGGSSGGAVIASLTKQSSAIDALRLDCVAPYGARKDGCRGVGVLGAAPLGEGVALNSAPHCLA